MWPFKKRKIYIDIGNERLEINPLTLPQTLELILLLSPYWPLLEANIQDIEAAIADNNKGFLSVIFFTLRDEMKKLPGDITKLIAILIGVEPEWLARNGTAEQIIKALPTLDKAHDLGRLWRIMREGSVHLAR
jgi:hypothetical protein